MRQVRSRVWVQMLIGGSLLAGCAVPEDGELVEETAFAQQAVIGAQLPGITAEEFAIAKEAFEAVEAAEDGVGPIFNEFACGNCHFQGAVGGAGTQIERRFGAFDQFGRFDPLAQDGQGVLPSRGGSLRQLMTIGRFTALNGRSCNIPLEREPPEAEVRNVGRQTTPLFGLGLVDAMPDSFFDALAAAQPASIRGIARRVPMLLPNVADRNQRIGGTRVGRFGWKAGIATLTHFSADAYINEMAITTQSCVNGVSVTTFAAESRPNDVPFPAGCDDLAPAAPAGVPAGTDDAVGPCAPGQTEIQDDVAAFTTFMTFLAPPDRAITDAAATARGQRVFDAVGCNGCHVGTAFRTPANPPTGVPGNFTFFPFSDFLVHDMGSLGDLIGDFGDSLAVTRRMRTAPLWGIRFRTQLLHDGRAADIPTAIRAHAGQAAASASAFGSLSAANQRDLVTFVRSL